VGNWICQPPACGNTKIQRTKNPLNRRVVNSFPLSEECERRKVMEIAKPHG
jgi:hypothetical protein